MSIKVTPEVARRITDAALKVSGKHKTRTELESLAREATSRLSGDVFRTFFLGDWPDAREPGEQQPQPVRPREHVNCRSSLPAVVMDPPWGTSPGVTALAALRASRKGVRVDITSPRVPWGCNSACPRCGVEGKDSVHKPSCPVARKATKLPPGTYTVKLRGDVEVITEGEVDAVKALKGKGSRAIIMDDIDWVRETPLDVWTIDIQWWGSKREKCPECDGEGSVPEAHPLKHVTCVKCLGAGTVHSKGFRRETSLTGEEALSKMGYRQVEMALHDGHAIDWMMQEVSALVAGMLVDQGGNVTGIDVAATNMVKGLFSDPIAYPGAISRMAQKVKRVEVWEGSGHHQAVVRIMEY